MMCVHPTQWHSLQVNENKKNYMFAAGVNSMSFFLRETIKRRFKESTFFYQKAVQMDIAFSAKSLGFNMRNLTWLQ